MPLVVRELVIRATVEHGPPSERPSSGDASTDRGAVHERQAIVAKCVDQILEILNRREER